jgi:hypothetical protein
MPPAADADRAPTPPIAVPAWLAPDTTRLLDAWNCCPAALHDEPVCRALDVEVDANRLEAPAIRPAAASHPDEARRESAALVPANWDEARDMRRIDCSTSPAAALKSRLSLVSTTSFARTV